jgi:hypothetical protein
VPTIPLSHRRVAQPGPVPYRSRSWILHTYSGLQITVWRSRNRQRFSWLCLTLTPPSPGGRGGIRSVPTALSKRFDLRLKGDCGPLIFLDICVPHGVQKRTFSTPDCIGLLSRILSLPRAPTEDVVDKEPADAAPTFLSLPRDGKSYDFPIDEGTQPTGLRYKRGRTAWGSPCSVFMAAPSTRLPVQLRLTWLHKRCAIGLHFEQPSDSTTRPSPGPSGCCVDFRVVLPTAVDDAHLCFQSRPRSRVGSHGQAWQRIATIVAIHALWYRASMNAYGEGRGIKREVLVRGVVGKTYA